MKFRLAVMVPIVLGVIACGHPAGAAAATAYERSMSEIANSAGKASDHDRLFKIFDLDWQYQMTEYPEWATAVGYPGQNARWTNDSLEAIERRKRELDAPMKALSSIDRSKLNEKDRLNYDIFKYRLNNALEGTKFPSELLPITQLDGVQQSPVMTMMQNPNATINDYEQTLERLRGVPTLVQHSIVLMKEGLKQNITPPKLPLRDVPRQISTQIVEDPQKSPLFEPFKNFPADIPAAEQERIRRTASGIISNSIVPAYKELLDFFVSTYEPACRETLALADLPDGKSWYAHNVRTSTTTQLTPEEIHNIGLSEVKRLRGEMDALIVKSGFKGSFQEFSEYLRSDPKFFYTNANDLIVGFRDIAKRIDPELIKQFGRLPRLQYGVEPVPAFTEESQPTAYYRPGNLNPGRAGIFFANTYDLKSRPKWGMEALTLHEAVPGHHMQIALAQEMEGLPNFRKHGGFTAYVEGWGLYAEGLGSDLGMYKDVNSQIGQLNYDMWRSIRLVLDTGIHAKGWTKQQAIDFFKENSNKPMHDIEVEVDRYIVWPGQALAYKLGQLEFSDLKRQARSELGDRFDPRAFHDYVLGLGAVPLDILKAQTKEWIIESRMRTTAQAASPQ